MSSYPNEQCADNILMRFSPNEREMLLQYFISEVNEQPKTIRKRFTPTEDDKLRSIVGQQKTPNWSTVAGMMEGRTPRQCKERWFNYLSPTISNEKWSEDEDKLLMKMYNESGPKWVRIAMHFPNRTDINIKNRWLTLTRKNIYQNPKVFECY